jgi:hypothetical protein
MREVKEGISMKRLLLVALGVVVLGLGMQGVSYASDWDKAGKALTIIEGLRVVSGGQVDIIGTVTGINNRHREEPVYRETVVMDRGYGHGYGRDNQRYARHDRGPRYVEERYYRCEPTRVWVPHYTWQQRYVPQHVEYHDGEKFVVEGHYVSNKVEEGGHWETRYD